MNYLIKVYPDEDIWARLSNPVSASCPVTTHPLQFAKENSRTLRKDLRDLSASSADLISLVLKQLYRIFQTIH